MVARERVHVLKGDRMMQQHTVVSREEWLEARKQLLRTEKAFTPDELARGEASYNYTLGNPRMADREGISVFYQNQDGEVFHTYSAYARGIDMVNGAYHFLDLAPKGRDEAGHDNPQFWVRHH